MGWQDAFLTEYEATGTLWRAAKVAGVSADSVERYRASDQDFAAKVEEARQLYADDLETTMHDQFVKGNVVAGIVLLKKHRPHQFIERHAILNVDVHIDVPTDQARQVLGEMLAHVTPSTVERLSAEQPHRDAAPLVPPLSAVAPRSGLILDVPAHSYGLPNEVSSDSSERLNPEFSGISARSPSAKEGDAAASAPLALPPAELVAAPPSQPRKPLNTGRQA